MNMEERILKNEEYKAKTLPDCADRVFALARHEGFEPPAFWSVARRSIQLS